MKKLIKLITGAFLLTALFTSCGNPAETAPEQDDGVQVEQFINKLMAVEYGINAAENAVIIHKMQNQEKSEYLYIKQNGSWISAGNIDLNNLKKENNEFYISADGKKIYSYSFTGNSLNLRSSESGFINFFGSNTVTFNKISKDNLPTEIKNVLETNEVTVEQFINKLMAVEYGINAAENAVIIHKMQNQEKSEYLYIKQNGSWISAGNIDLNNLKKENNEFYISADGKKIYSYSFTGNSLNLISSESGFINFFGSNTVTFNKISKDNLPTEIKNVLN